MKQKMACVETRSRGRKCLGRMDDFESADLPHGVLPKKAVSEVMLYLLRPRRAGQSVKKRCSRRQYCRSIGSFVISIQFQQRTSKSTLSNCMRNCFSRDSRKNESMMPKS